jgi:hypothetical protein
VDEPDQLWGWVDTASVRLGARSQNTEWASQILIPHHREVFLHISNHHSSLKNEHFTLSNQGMLLKINRTQEINQAQTNPSCKGLGWSRRVSGAILSNLVVVKAVSRGARLPSP